jgi:uncharacterized protein YjdB
MTPIREAIRTRTRTTPARALGRLLVLAALACGDDAGPGDPQPPRVASVEVLPAERTLLVGDAVRLDAVLRDATGRFLTGRATRWSSDGEGVAAVTQAGHVTAVSPGTAHVTAASEGKRATATIVVRPRPAVPVARLELRPTQLTLAPGESRTLVATPRDAEGRELADRTVTWRTTDATVATVDAAGTVTARAPGGVIVTATSETIGATASLVVRPAPVARALARGGVATTPSRSPDGRHAAYAW